jgi:endoglucanase
MDAQQVPFTRGVNVTGWFQTDSIKQFQFTKYTRKDFENLKSLGVNVVRLPINLHSMTNGAPAYTLNPIFLFFLDQVVDWVEELQINLILDNHTFDVATSTDTSIDNILISVWAQMAEHYKNRSTNIYYEVLNEPHGITDAKWNQIQQAVVESIRTVDQIHTIIVGPANWNSYNNLSAMPMYSDTNLLYTFHFYDPFLFTHQGADWTDLEPLAGIPFPYNATQMPALPSSFIGTWVESSYNNYHTDGTVQQVQNWLTVAAHFQKTRNVPIYCGEFGVYMLNSPDTDRVFWYETVRKYLEENKIPWTIWDYRGGFGLFMKNSDELFQNNLNIPVVNALGFSAPPQSEYIQEPDTSDLELYTDYVGQNIDNASYDAGTLDYYSTQNPFSGNYCIYWNGALQYHQIGFDFKPNKDLSYLKDHGYVFDCRIRGDVPTTSVDIRFVDTKTNDPNDHPWRMRYTINNSVVNFNNEWQHLQIPLNNFTEQGAWDNAWYEPVGLFDWKNIDLFAIVAEEGNLTVNNLWFDDIKIINLSSSLVGKDDAVPIVYNLAQNYPNPFNPTTVLAYQLAKNSYATLKIYDMLGREAATLIDGDKDAGSYTVLFDASRFASGIYFARFRASSKDGSTSFLQSRKLMLLK